jgi:Rrf2 family transcriptional regulator, iron-sulfur cluster assembly transcription factor
MAPRLNTSVGYLPQVLRPLVRVGWVASEPGPNGGYSLAIDLDQVSILDLIEVMEGPTDSNTCVLQGGPCGGTAYCALHVPWLEARQGLIDRLSEVPILETSERKE